MLFLMMFGALVPLHIGATWRSRKNLASGVAMLASTLALTATACGLYYLGSEGLRAWTSDLHIAIGLGFPLLLVLHAILGKRSRRRFPTRVP
jgi:hypothetical protein